MKQTEMVFKSPESGDRMPKAKTIEEAFETFHALNPWVYEHLATYARELKARGREHVGIKMLFEVLRWSFFMSTDDPNSTFKLNNNYSSRYARLIMSQEKDLDGIFRARELKAK